MRRRRRRRRRFAALFRRMRWRLRRSLRRCGFGLAFQRLESVFGDRFEPGLVRLLELAATDEGSNALCFGLHFVSFVTVASLSSDWFERHHRLHLLFPRSKRDRAVVFRFELAAPQEKL